MAEVVVVLLLALLGLLGGREVTTRPAHLRTVCTIPSAATSTGGQGRSEWALRSAPGIRSG